MTPTDPGQVPARLATPADDAGQLPDGSREPAAAGRLFDRRVRMARQALRGERPWTPDLSRSDVLAAACGAEFAALRAVVDRLAQATRP